MRDVLAVDHAESYLRDHVASRPSNECSSQDVRLVLSGQHLDEAVGDSVTDGSINLGELATVDRVTNAFFFQLLLSFSDSRYLRVRERAPG